MSDIFDFVNQGSFKTICEVGCGLGDIIREVKAPVKYGFDAHPGIIQAARLLTSFSFHKVRFNHFELRPDKIPSIQADVWILVNWIHKIPSLELKTILGSIYKKNLTHNGCIVIDSVSEDGKYFHDPRALSEGMNCSIDVLGKGYAFSGTIYIIKKSSLSNK